MIWAWLQFAVAVSLFGLTLDFSTLLPIRLVPFDTFNVMKEPFHVLRLASTQQIDSPMVLNLMNRSEYAFHIQEEDTLYFFGEDGKYYGTQISSLALLDAEWEPLTACFDCRNSIGCTITAETLFSISLAFTGVADSTFSLFASATLSLLKGVKHTYRTADGITCTLKNGESGQIFIKPLWFDNSKADTFIATFDYGLKKFRKTLAVTNRRKVKWAIKDDVAFECRISTQCENSVISIVNH